MNLDKTKELVSYFGGWVILIITAITFSTVIINISITASNKVPFSTTSFCTQKTGSVHEYKECLEILTK